MNRNNLHEKTETGPDWNAIRRITAAALIFCLLVTQMPLSFAAEADKSTAGTSGYQTGSNADLSNEDASGNVVTDEEEGMRISGTITFMDDRSAAPSMFDQLDLRLYRNGMLATGSDITVKFDKSGTIAATESNADSLLTNDLGPADPDEAGSDAEGGFLTWGWYAEGLPEYDPDGVPYRYSIRDMGYHPAADGSEKPIDGYALFYTDAEGAVIDTDGSWKIAARNLAYVQKRTIRGSFLNEEGAIPLATPANLIPGPDAEEHRDYTGNAYGWIDMEAGSWFIAEALMFHPATGEAMIWRGQVAGDILDGKLIRYENDEEYSSRDGFNEYIYEGGAIINCSTACQVTGTISWEDSGDELEKRPAMEEFTLQVTDADGAPVPDAVIEIKRGASDDIWNYTIRGLSVNNTYKVKATAPVGYIGPEEEIEFTAKADLMMETSLVMQAGTPGSIKIKANAKGLDGSEEVTFAYTLMADGEKYTGRYTIQYEDGTTATGRGTQISLIPGKTAVVQLTDTVAETAVAVRPVSPENSGVMYIGDSFNEEENSYIFRYSALKGIEACIVWNDNNNYDGERPYSGKSGYLDGEQLELYFSLDGGDTYQSAEDHYGILQLARFPGFSILPPETGSDWYFIADGLPAYIYINDEWIKVQYQARVAAEAEEPGYMISEPEYTETADREYWKITYTKELLFKATVQWYDDNENNQVRPGMDSWKDTLTVYQMGKDGKPVPVEASGFPPDLMGEQDQNDESKWNLTISGLPEYDEDGYPYVYYAVPADAAPGDDNALLNQEAELSYVTEYENTGNYTLKTNGCYQGGTIVNTLQGTMDFLMTKIWSDGGSGGRPEVKLVLWRYVKGEDYLTAARVDPEREPVIDSTVSPCQVTISDLPLIDGDGHEYIYFIKEEMDSPGDYKQEAANVDPYDSERGAEQLVFHQGTLNNKLSGTETISGKKTWKAKSVQGMEAAITVQLQRREKGQETWEVVKEQEVSGFRAEVMSREFTLEEADKYSEEGIRYEYRTVETGGSITYPDGTFVNFEIPKDSDVNEPYRFQAGNYEFERTTGPDGTIINTLVGETAIEIDKYWNQYDGTGELHFHIFRNDENSCICEELAAESDITLEADGQGGHRGGLVMTPENAVTPGDNSHWNYLLEGLPKYDEEGTAYSYKISEETPDGYTCHQKLHYGTSEGAGYEHLIAKFFNNNQPGGGVPSIKVTKTWLDDSDLLHREAVTVELLYKDGSSTGETLTLSADNVWTGYFTLPAEADYSDYRVKEIKVGEAGRQDAADADTYPYFNAAYHTYEVVEEKSIDANGAEWKLTNRRAGLIDIDLTKTWAAGGEETGYSAEFILKRNGESFEPAVRLGSDEWDAAAGVFHKTIRNLPKYDDNGKLYEYTLIERKANGETITNDQFTYGGITYQSGLRLTRVVWAEEHDGNDTYYWTAVNKRIGTSDLKFHKIWKDDLGHETASRPGIYLKLYRWTDKNANGELDEGEGTPESLEKLAKWEWVDDYHQIIIYQALPEYNDQGYPYVYYAEEGVQAPNHGGWQKVYFDGCPEPAGDYGGDYSRLIPLEKGNGKIAMPANGIVVNHRTGKTFVSGRKIWENMGVLNKEDYPEIKVSLNVSLWDPDQGNYGFPQPVKDQNGDPVTAMIKAESGNYVSTYNFAELPKYDTVTGAKIRYTVSEELQTDQEAVANFQMRNMDFGFSNTYCPDNNLSIEVTKEWNWGSLENKPEHFTGYPPVMFVLYRVIQKRDETLNEYVDAGYAPVAAGQKILTGSMSDGGQTSVFFEALPYYASNGRPYRYYVKELVPGGYTSTASGSNSADVDISVSGEGEYSGTCKVTNTYTEQTVKIRGTKTWSGDSGWGIRPDIDPGITLTLWRKWPAAPSGEAGEKVEAELVWLQSYQENKWLYEFRETTEPFYRYATTGREYTYFVKEEAVPGYKAPAGFYAGTKNKEDGSIVYTVNITNALDATELEVVKVWNDGGNRYGARPENITVKLQRKAEGENTFADVMNPEEENSVWTKILTGDSGTNAGWKTVFSGLPKYQITYDTNGAPVTKEYAYRAVELDPDASYSVITDSTTKPDTTIITNRLKSCSLTVEKIWDDSAQGYDREKEIAEITFKLQRRLSESGENFADVIRADGAAVTKTVPVTAQDTISFIFADLPKYNGAGNEYEYRAIETGFTLTAEYGGGPVFPDSQDGLSGMIGGYTFESENTKSEDGGKVIITNKLLRRKVSVKKVWEDADNQDGVRLTGLTMELRYDGKSYEPVQTAELSPKNGWKHEWENLPAEHADGVPYKYSVAEIKMEGVDENRWGANNGYVPSCNGTSAAEEKLLTVTNSRTPETVSYTVYKFWEDSNEHDWSAERPDSIQVQLYRQVGRGAPAAVENGLATLYAEAAGGHDAWTYTWKELPKYAREGGIETEDGVSREIQYSVKEVIPEDGTGYVAVINGNKITNQLKTTRLTVAKKWEDQNNYYGIRPRAITIQLQRSTDGRTWKNVDGMFRELDVQDSWQNCAFIGLPVRDKDNNPYEYRAVEAYMDTEKVTNHAASGYQVSYEHGSDGETVITNTLETVKLSGKKIWEDQSNAYGTRPENIRLTLKSSPEDVWAEGLLEGLVPEWSKTGDTWTYTYAGLPKYTADGKTVMVYSVEETAVEGYEVSYDEPHTNLANTMQTGFLAVTKIQEGGFAADFTFRIKLTTNGAETLYTGAYKVLEKGAGWKEPGEERRTDETGAIVIRRDQQFVIAGLPAGAAYEVTEEPVKRYALAGTVNDAGVVPNQDAANAFFTNKYTGGGGNGGGDNSGGNGGTTPTHPDDDNLVEISGEPPGTYTVDSLSDEGIPLGQMQVTIGDGKMRLAAAGDTLLPYALLITILLGAAGSMAVLVWKRKKEE